MNYDEITVEMSNEQGYIATLFAGWNHGAAMY